MDAYVALNRSGKPWTPKFIVAISDQDCIGCGRCFKVCGHGVLAMIGIDEDGETCDAFDDEALRKVMTVAAAGECIGCGACARVCGKNAQTHETAAVVMTA